MATLQSGLVSGNSQNKVGGATPRNRSLFPLSYSFFQTERFAEYVPFYVCEGVSGDRLPLHSRHEVQTYTLKSPILQSLAKKKDYFAVPMQAILPLNWEKFYTNPNIGEDVPVDCGTGVEGFWTKMKTIFVNSFTYVESLFVSGTDTQKLDALLHFLLFFEQIYSTGSLLETLGISGHNWLRLDYKYQGLLTRSAVYDEFFDAVIGALDAQLQDEDFVISISQRLYDVSQRPADIENSSVVGLSLREALELMRDDFSFVVTQVSWSGSAVFDAIEAAWDKFDFTPLDSDAPLNLARLWAYQLVCYHFYSNDHVDFIYSADLFRQYIGQLAFAYPSSTVFLTPKFSVNGFFYEYDYLSSHAFSIVYGAFGSDGIFSLAVGSQVSLLNAMAYFRALFGFNRSLRFLDYFTGSRVLPLAVGDHEASVNANGKVDIIELSKTSMMTKFLQAVNRSGRKFSAYMQELFGRTPAYDYHNPMYLAHTSDLVGAQETDNTGAAQVALPISVTSRLRATSSRYAFEFSPDRDCVVIGISYYDIPRVYTRSTERQNFYLDRFDMFNPFLQFIGDQDITEAEIGTTTPDISKPFSYTNRHMEYKQRYNQACGAFCVPSSNLRNWIFEADTLRRKMIHNISPEFIRSFNSELDHFYQSLSGYSLGTYFHFIVRYDNRMNASRPMAYNPTINV